MANELKITDVVDSNAINQVLLLNAELKGLKTIYTQVAIELGKQIKVPATSYESLSNKASAYQTTLVRLNKTVKDMNEVQQQQVRLLNEVNNKMNSMNAAKNLADVFSKLANGVDKLNDLLDKLVKNHQQASQALGSLGNVATQVNQQFAEVSVNYGQLSATIEGYSAEITNLAKNITNNQSLLAAYRNEQKNLDKEYKDGVIPLSEYLSRSAELKQRIGEVSAEIQKEQNILRNHSQAVVAAEGSYNQMNAAMLELQKRYKELSEAERESGIGQGILDQASKLNGKLKEIDAKFGNYQRNVGNYASAFNGLGYQVTQVVRELPALNSGFNTFMIAIGNNLPMLVDEIDRARKLNANLAQDGHQTVPVWKQVTGAIFNWQTALVVGLTLITMYWKDIANFFQELFTGAKAAKSVSEAFEDINEQMGKSASNYANTMTTLEDLSDEWDRLGDNLKEKNIFIEENQDRFDELGVSIKDAAEAENLLVTNKEKFIEAMQQRAMSVAAANLATKEYEEALKRQMEIAKMQKKRDEEDYSVWDMLTSDKWLPKFTTEALNETFEKNIKSEEEKIKTLIENAKRFIEIGNNSQETAKEILKDAGIDESSKETKMIKERAKKERDILEELLQTRIDLIEDARKRELAQNEKDFTEKMEGLEKESELYKNYEELMRREALAINEKYDEEERKAREEALKLLQEEAEREVEIVGNKYAMRALTATNGLQKELEALSDEYAKGLIDAEEYEEKRTKLTNDYAIESAKLGIEMVKKQLETENLSAEKRMELNQALIDAENALKDAVIASNEEQARAREEALAKAREGFEALRDVADESVEGMGDIFDGLFNLFETLEKKSKLSAKEMSQAILGAAIQIVDGVKEMVSGMYESRIEELEKEEEANEEAGEKEMERIEQLAEHGAISEEEAEARKRAAEDKTAAKNAEVEKKKAELMTKQAKFEKAMNITQTIMATSLAVTKALPNLVLAALVGAMGAVQLATIIAQPIPKYAKGTKDHKGGLAIVGDGGKREGVITEKGLWVTPDTPTLIDLPKHAMVVPDIQKYLSAKGLQSDLLNKSRGKNEPVVVNVNNDYTKLEREMMGNRGELRKLTKVVKKMSRASELRGIYGRL